MVATIAFEPPLPAGISILSKKYQVLSPAAQAFRDMLIGSFAR